MSVTLCTNPKLTFDNGDLARFAQIATSITGLEFPECRLPDLVRAVRETIRQFSLASDNDLYRLLAAKSDHAVKRAFISHLTIGETHFFRNQPQFDALTATILPEIIARRQSQRRLRIWSAACATGEEPYSVAILLDRLLPDYANWDVSILATDIDQQALERAQRGIYSAWSFRQVDETLRARYFTEQGRFYELAPHIRRRVTFAPLNLVEADYPSQQTNTAQIDLILCRNVLIYFSPATTRPVVDRLYMALNEGGWLLVGHAEPSQELFARYVTVNLPDTVVYRRSCTPAPPPPMAPTRDGRTPFVLMQPASAVASQYAEASTPVQPIAHGREATGRTPEVGELLARASGPTGDGMSAYQLACIYAERRQWIKAEQWVGKAIERLPLLGEAHYLHALLLLEAGQIDAAIMAARRCIYADPAHVAGHMTVAMLYQRRGEQRRAVSALTYAHNLLQRHAADAIVPETDGATARQLLTLIEGRLKQLNAQCEHANPAKSLKLNWGNL